MSASPTHPPPWIDRLPAGLKLAAALSVIVGTVLMPPRSPAWFVIVTALLFAAVIAARLPWLYWCKRLLWLAPFVLAVAVTNAFSSSAKEGAPLSWPTVALKSSLCLTTILVLNHTTPFSAILRTLQAFRVPGLLVTTMVLMQRYLFVLSDEALRMRRARASRTFAHSRPFQWHLLSSIIGQLFIRAADRAERIYNAMCARGWK